MEQSCFFVVYPDGSATDFSYRTCLQGLARGGAAEAAAGGEGAAEGAAGGEEGSREPVGRVITTKAALAELASAAVARP